MVTCDLSAGDTFSAQIVSRRMNRFHHCHLSPILDGPETQLDQYGIVRDEWDPAARSGEFIPKRASREEG